MSIAIEIVIFLTLLCFFLTYLISNKKIESVIVESFIKSALKIVLLLSIFISGLLVFVLYQDRAVVPMDLAGIKLSMNKDEVLYTIGNPLNTYPDLDDSYLPLQKSNLFTLASFPKNNNFWQYSRKAYELNIFFDKNSEKIQGIRCLELVTESFPQSSECQTNTISLGSSEDKVLEKFGSPDSVVLNDGIKTIVYKKFKTEFLLKKQKVTGVIVRADIQ